MKKKILTLVVIAASAALVGSAVYAWGPGYRTGSPGYGPWGGPGLTSEQQAKMTELQKSFFEETDALRREMYQKRLELSAILAKPEPDEQQATAKMKELNDARQKLDEKALQFRIKNREALEGMPGFGTGYRGHRGYDKGAGYGPGMSRRGPQYGPGGQYRPW